MRQQWAVVRGQHHKLWVIGGYWFMREEAARESLNIEPVDQLQQDLGDVSTQGTGRTNVCTDLQWDVCTY